MGETSKFKNYLQGIALLIFLVGLPLGSWYYLQAGFDYNKELMAELKNYGRIPDFNLIDQDGKTLTRKDLEGKVVVVDFFNSAKSSYPETMDYLRRFYKQFHDRQDLVFLSHSLESNAQENGRLKAVAEREKLDNEQNYFLTATASDDLLKLLSKGYQIPDIENRQEDKTIPRSSTTNLPSEYPYFVLVDVSGTIRNYYKIEEASITRLVEHMALILPRKSEEKAQLKRETEK